MSIINPFVIRMLAKEYGLFLDEILAVSRVVYAKFAGNTYLVSREIRLSEACTRN